MADKLSHEWGQIKGKLREHWGRLTNDDVEEINGKRENMIAKIQERYDETRESAEEKLKEFESKL